MNSGTQAWLQKFITSSSATAAVNSQKNRKGSHDESESVSFFVNFLFDAHTAEWHEFWF